MARKLTGAALGASKAVIRRKTPVTVRSHEGALAASCTLDLPSVPFAEAIERTGAALALLAGLVQAQGALIGHIKAGVEADGASAFLSTTDGRVSVRTAGETAAAGCKAQLSAIVVGLSKEALEAGVQRAADVVRTGKDG